MPVQEVPATKPAPQPPSLFCFSVARAGLEIDLLKWQLQNHAGIFACDKTAVLSDVSVLLGEGVNTITLPPIVAGVSKDGTAANAATFMQAYDRLQADGRWATADWTVKLDPDAVVIPWRLKPHLLPFNGRGIFLQNCNAYPGQHGWPMMFGALEAISKPAIIAYFAGKQRCIAELKWQSWGEDVFMAKCLMLLGIAGTYDATEILDGKCSNKPPWCGDGAKAAFHPLKSVAEWQTCWQEAVP